MTLHPFQPPNFDYDAEQHQQYKSIRITIPLPQIGSKIACIKDHGIWVLEEGATLWRAMMCTHAGSGGYVVYDGVPDENGFFHQSEEWLEIEKDLSEKYSQCTPSELLNMHVLRLEHWQKRNGREVAYANPAVLGCWMFDAGLIHGLTLKCLAEHQAVAPILSLTWQPARKR